MGRGEKGRKRLSRKSKGEADRERKRERKRVFLDTKEKQTQLTEDSYKGFSPRTWKV